ncbi:hypothetical protein CFR75_12320 [Komagataeibacter xylinus]|uniref:Antitoxin VbhA domain-containing protein n=4 Tax=Acetobacteraceae TaxID=433 RepID=A0A967EEK4_9PROT|nr:MULTISPECIES: antitoxin VbhA family protein [Acetobacter]NHO55150.1 hypothetical protein [Acetobacter estunensis]PYD56205.1 hypothetical protein CFR75_12320 [Komagataeibacter xylinus]GBQ67940.1 hypothetical protein AA15237_0276 [Komagataeibacter xylinus NBRC 15237]MBB3884396.1 hypothetical protein [Acetobacter oeni]NHO20327.1 hypothetical protein [Acetobacter oeni]
MEECGNNDQSRPSITAEERRQRQEAVDYARGSCRLEGVILDAEIERINTRFIQGELTMNEHFEELQRHLDR